MQTEALPRRRFSDLKEIAPSAVAALSGDHPAVTEGRTLFPSRVFSADAVPRVLISGVNPDLSEHGLRKLSATRCAEAGATEHQLMALFGWTSTKQAAIYTRRANRARLEADAAALMLGEQKSDIGVPLSPVALSGGTIRRKTP